MGAAPKARDAQDELLWVLPAPSHAQHLQDPGFYHFCGVPAESALTALQHSPSPEEFPLSFLQEKQQSPAGFGGDSLAKPKLGWEEMCAELSSAVMDRGRAQNKHQAGNAICAREEAMGDTARAAPVMGI